MESDVELAAVPSAPSRLNGYPSFAAFIAKDKDAAIHRKFESLSGRSLLYQQSELHDLQRQLEEIDLEDAKEIGDINAQRAARLWHHYSTDTNRQSLLRRNLQGKIRIKIKEYRR